MISIIIPVYNVESYLRECLDTVLAQTYSDWECILVDDGSTDGSGAICDEYAERTSSSNGSNSTVEGIEPFEPSEAIEPRIRVIHQPNAGVSAARNVGLGAAQGDYVCFIDSDDWVGENYLQHLLENLQDADLAVVGLQQDFSNGTSTAYCPPRSSHFYLNQEGLEDFVDLNRKFLLYGPVQKLYRRDIIETYGIRFPEDCSYGEDLQFNYRYLEHVRSIAQVASCDYHYRIICSGTLSSKKRPDQFQQDYEQWQLLKSFYVCHNLWLEPTKQLLYQRLWGIVYDCLFSTATSAKQILSIPEIKELKPYQQVFPCSRWIKWCILHKITFAFRR